MAQVQRLYNFANGTKSDAEQVDAEFDNLIQGVNTLDGELYTHKSSGDHDSRYYTKSQTDTQINNAVANVQASKFVETGTSFPSNPTKGQTFYHETEEQLYIYDGAEWVAQITDTSSLQKEIANLNLQLEASQRVTNGKTFGTDFLNTFNMTIDYSKTTIQGATSAGVNTVTVTNATPFKVGQEVTIYDDVKLERVVISNISGNNITFTTSLVNSYKDKANVARTMAILDTVNNCLKFGGWSTGTTKTVTDATVVSSAYSTSGNGGRKLVRLSNGWLVAAEIDTSATPDTVRFQKYDGSSWSDLCYIQPISNDIVDVALASKGTMVYVLATTKGTSSNPGFWKIDAETQSNVNINGDGVNIDPNLTDIGKCTLIINDAGTELHAAWASKNSTYPHSFNIRYAKSTINADGSVSWGSVEQVTTISIFGHNYINPCIIVKDGIPCILFEQGDYSWTGTTEITSSRNIVFIKRSTGLSTHSYLNSNWTYNTVYANSYPQSSPCAIFVPQSVNGLTNGRIAVWWHGRDSTDTTYYNIRFAYSDDGGVTWSSMQKLTTGNTVHRQFASGTVDKNGKYYVEYEDNGTIKRLESTDGGITWGSPITVGTGTHVSTLYDNTFNLNFSNPLSIRMSGSSVLFKGTWTTGTETPLLENDVRFTVSDAEEIVTWVQRDEGLTLTGYLNGNTMTKTSVTGEDQFTYDLGSVQPTEVKLKMTRANTTDDFKITKILGGVA
jgi:hypothetical protein